MSDSSFEEIRDIIADTNEEALLADGFEDALIGYIEIFNRMIALYDKEKCIEILMKRDGMDYEGAHDYFAYNVQDAFMGENTPVFATILKKPAH